MKSIFLFFSLWIISFGVQGQESFKIYLDEDGVETDLPSNAIYYQTGELSDRGNKHGLVKTFTLNGTLVSQVTYYYGKEDGIMTEYYPNGKVEAKTNYAEGKRLGKFQAWYKNGQLKEEGEWVQTKEFFPIYFLESSWDSTGTSHIIKGDGSLIEYSEQGNILRKETYKNGIMLTGIAYDETGKEWTYEKREKMAEFHGGIPKLMKYLQNNLKYPRKARSGRISGTVYVKFTVSKDGTLKNIIYTGRYIGYGLEDEATRVVVEMPKWTPGYKYGKPIAVQFLLPIQFMLN